MTLMGFAIDTTIHLSDVLLVGGGIYSFFKMFLSQRDINRDVLKILRGENGKNGLVSDVKGLKRDMYETGGAVPSIRIGLAAKGIVLHHDER